MKFCEFSSETFYPLGFMIGYLGYCRRVEPKVECGETESSETEEYFPEIPARLSWPDLKAMLSEKLNNVDFLSTIR